MNLNKLDDEDDMEHDRFEDGAFISQINAWCSKQMKLAAAYALENSSCFLAVRQKPGIALCVISGNIDETAKEFLLSEIILSELENEYFRADDLITELQRIIEIAKQHPSMTA